jgi:DGQHR domain-containing protein
MPTSVLVNIRNNATYEPGANGLGTIDFADEEPLWIVDGQHRIGGLRRARERQQPLPYQLPVVFTLGLDIRGEMELFYVVNHEQKNVPTDLTFEILRRHVEKLAEQGDARLSLSQLRHLAAVQIVRILANDPMSVWFGQVQMADEIRAPDKPIRLATLAKSLRDFLSGDWAHNLVLARDHNPLVKAVGAYWQALQMLMPVGFADAKTYSVQSPTAAYAFGWVLRDMARLADKQNDWSPTFFASQLQVLDKWVEAGTWHKAAGDPLTRAKGAGVARLIFEQMVPLYRMDDVAHYGLVRSEGQLYSLTEQID